MEAWSDEAGTCQRLLDVRTQVGIVGAGPAGVLLSHLLHLQGIDSVVLERHDRRYVEHRVRAGVLEHGTAETLREAGVGKRMDEQGMRHEGIELRFAGRGHRIDFAELAGRSIMVYGQQEVVKDLIAERLAAGGEVRFSVDDVRLDALDTNRPRIACVQHGRRAQFECDFVVGADGSQGISRMHVPGQVHYERHYPFAWLGILAAAPPSSHELIYARHRRGFALHSMRTPQIIRMYLQVAERSDVADWTDERIWAELRTRLSTRDGFELADGPVLERGITTMRSVVVAPMQFGRLFLAGDAAHIVPPTGAKGMNLAVADVRLLSHALGAYYTDGREDLLAGYTEAALRRVWRSTHFSWWMTSMLHVDPREDAFGERLAVAQLEYVASSPHAAASLAENYTGLPYPQAWSYR